MVPGAEMPDFKGAFGPRTSLCPSSDGTTCIGSYSDHTAVFTGVRAARGFRPARVGCVICSQEACCC